MKEIIGSKETAEILQISLPTLIKHLQKGKIKIPYSKLGSHYKFRRKDVEEYFKSSFRLPKEHKD